jgi:uncharacterized membrane protein
MRTPLVLITAIVAQTAGNVFLSKAMKNVELESFANLYPVILQTLHNPGVWIGTALLIVFFALYSAALSWADLSFVLPATSFGYIVNVAAAHYFLNEPVSTTHWAGTFLIATGVILVSRSAVRAQWTAGVEKRGTQAHAQELKS